MTGGRNINAIPIGVAGGSDRTAREGHSTAIHQGTRRQVYGTNEVRLDFIPCFFLPQNGINHGIFTGVEETINWAQVFVMFQFCYVESPEGEQVTGSHQVVLPCSTRS